MAAEIDLKVGQSTLRVHGAVCADAIDDEAVIGDWGLEPLQSIPWRAIRQNSTTASYH